MLQCILDNTSKDTGESNIMEVQFCSGTELILISTNIGGMYDMAEEGMIQLLVNYINQGSGRRLVKVIKCCTEQLAMDGNRPKLTPYTFETP
jgi:hypothetical protein